MGYILAKYRFVYMFLSASTNAVTLLLQNVPVCFDLLKPILFIPIFYYPVALLF